MLVRKAYENIYILSYNRINLFFAYKMSASNTVSTKPHL